MPPRVQLTDAKAARLPALLRASPATLTPFPRDGSNVKRVLWVLAAYPVDEGLSPTWFTWLVFDECPNVALEVITTALRQARDAGWVTQTNGFQLSPAGETYVPPDSD